MSFIKNFFTKKENIIYLVIWILLFLSPVVDLYIHNSTDNYVKHDWGLVFNAWKMTGVVFVLFIIHNRFLAPLLIYKQKKWHYISGVLAIILLFVLYLCVFQPMRLPDRHPMMEERMGPPSHDEGMAEYFPGPPEGDMMMDEPNHDKQGPHHPKIWGDRSTAALLFLFFVLMINLGIKAYIKSDEDKKNFAALEARYLEQQLNTLKHQINPHFLMNTLNNIHALVDINPESAKECIVELSKFFRYILYKDKDGFILIEKEVNFIKHYLRLMEIRFSDCVTIESSFPESIPNKTIPSLLLITFVENAFKHGISYKDKSFINIKFDIKDDRLIFICENSNHDNKNNNKGGVGLENARKRLELLFPNNYVLDIKNEENTFHLHLDIPTT